MGIGRSSSGSAQLMNAFHPPSAGRTGINRLPYLAAIMSRWPGWPPAAPYANLGVLQAAPHENRRPRPNPLLARDRPVTSGGSSPTLRRLRRQRRSPCPRRGRALGRWGPPAYGHRTTASLRTRGARPSRSGHGPFCPRRLSGGRGRRGAVRAAAPASGSRPPWTVAAWLVLHRPVSARSLSCRSRYSRPRRSPHVAPSPIPGPRSTQPAASG